MKNPGFVLLELVAALLIFSLSTICILNLKIVTFKIHKKITDKNHKIEQQRFERESEQ